MITLVNKYGTKILRLAFRGILDITVLHLTGTMCLRSLGPFSNHLTSTVAYRGGGVPLLKIALFKFSTVNCIKSFASASTLINII